jgi:hypothetical protein
MKQTKIGNRFIVIGRPELATEKIAYRQPTNQRPTSQRIVVIKDGQLVGRALIRPFSLGNF